MVINSNCASCKHFVFMLCCCDRPYCFEGSGYESIWGTYQPLRYN